MSQVTSYVIAGKPLLMSALKVALDGMFAAAASCNRGPTAPPNPFEGMLWWDTSGGTTELLKRYSVTVGWITLLSLDISTGATTPYRNGVALGTMSAEAASDYLAKSEFAAEGDFIYASAANTPTRRAVGTEGQLLSVVNGLPDWIDLEQTPGAEIGDIRFSLTSVPRANELKLNGASLIRSEYSELWTFATANSLTTTEANWSAGYFGLFSTGNGYTTFKLPDFRGMHLRVFDEGRGVDSGRAFGAFQDSQNLSHGHSVSVSVSVSISGSNGFAWVYPQAVTSEGVTTNWGYGPASVTGSGSGSGSGSAAAAGGGETRVKNLPLYFFIRFE